MAGASGIPLGGVGAGSVELRPDGGFYDWDEIFQLGQKPQAWPENRSDVFSGTPTPNMPPDALAFVLRTQIVDGEPVVRTLGMNPNPSGTLYSSSWLKSVQEIAFEQRFPVARLRYEDASLPIKVTSEFSAPFVPHDARTSGTPGFYATYRLRNDGDRTVSASLLACMRNPIHDGMRDRGLVNTVSVEGGTAYLDMSTIRAVERRPTTGSMCLAANGGELSWVAGEYRAFMGQGTSFGSPSYASWMQGLYRDLRAGLAGAARGRSTAPTEWRALTDADVDAMDITALQKLAADLCEMPYVADIRRRVESAEPGALDTDDGLRVFVKTSLAGISAYGGADDSAWGDGALIVDVTLEPGEEREIRFALSWHFPYHYAANEELLGHMYENWFADAGEACRYLVANRDDIVPVARRFADTLCDTSLDEVYPNAWSGQLGTLVKCSWWIRNGRFGIWEGLRCCGFHTMDISYQGSFSLLALFPELETVQMELSTRYQRDDGRIPHLLAVDLQQVDDDFERVDMNPQFVLLTCRDWLWTGDRSYLERQWPGVVRALDNMLLLDADGDGLPDHDTRKNTYDNWNFYGTPSYIASLWLAALTAASRMAADMGDAERAGRWESLRESCAASFDEKLWNGEYYSLWVDGDLRDECCMADQIDGEWFAKVVGLPPGLPEERIQAACDAVMRHDYTDEGGLLNAAYPADFAGTRIYHTFQNIQADANWTGIEYLFAALLYGYGRIDDARAVVQNIEDRHARAGETWNHLECGNHYYRAMSSWTLMLAASGFTVDIPASRITIAPVEDDIRTPWVSSTGWGTLEQRDGTLTISCDGGTLAFAELRVKPSVTTIRINDAVAAAGVSAVDGLTVLSLAEPVDLVGGDRVTVE